MGLTDKQAEAIDRIKQKSDDDYEKNVVYIAAGTLVLSMTFLEKIIKVETSTFIWVLIVGWGFLALTLLCNLLSHQLSSWFHEKCRENYEACNEPAEDALEEEIQRYNGALAVANRKFDGYNRLLRNLNWATTFSLFIGIVLLVVFCSANALKANSSQQLNTNRKNLIDTTMSKQIKPQTQDVDITKGRTISASVKPTAQPNNTTSNSGNQTTNSSSGNNQSENK